MHSFTTPNGGSRYRLLVMRHPFLSQEAADCLEFPD